MHRSNIKIFNSLIFFLVIFIFLGFQSNNVIGQTDSLTSTVAIAVCGNDYKESLEQCDGPDFNGKTCVTLGFDSGDLSCRASCQFLTTDCVSGAETYDEDVFNTTTGGELSLINSNTTEGTIEIPINAYSTNLSLFAFSLLSSSVSSEMPAPSGKSFVGNVYNFKFFDESGNRVTSLLNSASLTITYLDADFSGLEESEIKPYHYNEEDEVWYLVPGSTLQQGLNTISFDTTSFSHFALFSTEPSDNGNGNNNNDNGNGGGGGSGSGGGWGGNGNNFRNSFRRGVDVPSNIDFNSDGLIDITDLSILLYFWSETGSKIEPYDLNSDGIIDIVDASILFYHWTG